MNNMSNNQVEKSRKSVEQIFNIIFIIKLIECIIVVAWKLLFLFGIAKYNIVSNIEVFSYLIAVFLYGYCAKLAKEGNQAAGVFGIVLGAIRILMSLVSLSFLNVVNLIISIALVYSSIKYINGYKK